MGPAETHGRPNSSQAHVDAPYLLLALDLDGTVLDPESRVRDATRAAVRAAVEAGVTVILASGRSPRQIRSAHAALRLDTPVVAYHGAVVVDLATGQTLYHVPVKLDVAQRVLAIIRRHHPDVNLHVETMTDTGDEWHVERLDERVQSFVDRYNSVPPDTIGEIQRLLRDEATTISRLWFRAPVDTMVTIKDQLVREMRREIDTLAFDDVTLTVLGSGVTKASAISWLAERHGIARERVMAIGDEVNDIPLLGWAGLGVAMANARAPVKELAHVVTGSNADDGAADAIWRYALRRAADGRDVEVSGKQ